MNKTAERKPSKKQLESRIENAVLFVPKDKEYKSVRFSDRGLTLEKTKDFCVISTNFHSHVFHALTSNGISAPYTFTSVVIDIAIENKDKMEVFDDKKNVVGYSFDKLLDYLESNGKDNESINAKFNILKLYNWWLMAIFGGLYAIGETERDAWNVFFQYILCVANCHILLDEHKEDVSSQEYVDKFCGLIKSFTKDLKDHVAIPKLTDEERLDGELKALEDIANEMMENAQNGSKD